MQLEITFCKRATRRVSVDKNQHLRQSGLRIKCKYIVLYWSSYEKLARESVKLFQAVKSDVFQNYEKEVVVTYVSHYSTSCFVLYSESVIAEKDWGRNTRDSASWADVCRHQYHARVLQKVKCPMEKVWSFRRRRQEGNEVLEKWSKLLENRQWSS